MPEPPTILTVRLAGVDLVGRGDELAVLERLLAAGGGSRVLAVTGDPGIGKTRLLAELRRRAERLRWTVLSGQGSEWSPEAPYGAVVDALDPLPPRAADVLAPALRGAGPRGTPAGPGRCGWSTRPPASCAGWVGGRRAGRRGSRRAGRRRPGSAIGSGRWRRWSPRAGPTGRSARRSFSARRRWSGI